MTFTEESFLAAVAEGLDPTPDPYMGEPIDWIRHRLGEDVWSKQIEILESVRDHRLTAVRSCHSSGKSHIAARAIGHWIDTHPIEETFVVSTAPSAPQVKAILWRYLKSIQRKADLGGYITEGEVPEWKINGTLVAWGRKPQDLKTKEEAATAFQGVHAKYLLVILDEAGGIPEWLWTAVDSLVTQPTNRVLAIGNPDDPSSHFERICRPDSPWNKIKISAFDTPNFTGERVSEVISENLVSQEWVNERKWVWGDDSPLYTSKVLAEFPVTTDDNLIQINWIQNAMARDFSGEAIEDLGKWAMDIARGGRDEATLAYWRAGMFRIIWSQRGVNDTMKLVDKAQAFCYQHPTAKGIVDADGIGGPVFDRMRQKGIPVSPFYAGRTAFEPKKYFNRRSEQWWKLRLLMRDGLVDIDPADDKLQAQLGSLKWWEDSKGRINVETKKDLKERGFPSPDRGDTLMMITAPMEEWMSAYLDPLTGLAFTPEHTLTSDLLEKLML